MALQSATQLCMEGLRQNAEITNTTKGAQIESLRRCVLIRIKHFLMFVIFLFKTFT